MILFLRQGAFTEQRSTLALILRQLYKQSPHDPWASLFILPPDKIVNFVEKPVAE